MIRAAFAAASLLVACEGSTPDGPAADAVDSGAPIALARVSGDSQVGRAERLLEEFLVFRVTDPGGRPVPGLRVEWQVVTGGGQVSGKRHETDAEGLAAGNFTLGPDLGKNVARATVRGTRSIDFTAYALSSGTHEADRRPAAD